MASSSKQPVTPQHVDRLKQELVSTFINIVASPYIGYVIQNLEKWINTNLCPAFGA